MKKLVFLALTLLALTGCGEFRAIHHLSDEPPVGTPGYDGLIVHSRATFLVTHQNGQTVVQRIYSFMIPQAFAANPTSVPITVVNAPNASMTVNSSTLTAGPITNDILGLGSATITDLRDNQLKVCGTGNQKCGTAVIRMYTTGSAGAGLYNTADGYGAPLRAGMGATRSVVGLGAANAAIVQTYTIPSNKNVIRETDFASPMTYNVDSDFSNAGSGTYTTTLVIEYGLAL